MTAQALSGIAKDLTKMSSKSAIKVVVPEGQDGALFKWVARLTGSKNALKGLWLFRGRCAVGSVWLRRRACRHGGGTHRGTAHDCNVPVGRSWAIEEKDQVHLSLVEEPGDQLAFRRAPVPVCVKGRLVRRGIAGIPQPARMVVVFRRSISRLMGDRIRLRSGGGSGNTARSREPETVDGSAAQHVGVCAGAHSGESGRWPCGPAWIEVSLS